MKKITKLVGSGLSEILGLTLLLTLASDNVFSIRPKITLKISSKLCSRHICTPLWQKKPTNMHIENYREVSTFFFTNFIYKTKCFFLSRTLRFEYILTRMTLLYCNDFHIKTKKFLLQTKPKNCLYTTKNSGYNMTKIPLQHNFPLTLAQNFFENTIFWLQYHKTSLKKTQNSGFQNFFENKILVTISQNFFQKNTKFLVTIAQNFFQKHKILVTISQNFFQKHKIPVTIIQLFQKTIFSLQCDKNSSRN